METLIMPTEQYDPIVFQSDPLWRSLRPNFPVITEAKSGLRIELKYVDSYEVLEGFRPKLDEVWGDWVGIVADSRLEPLGRSGYGELTVVTLEEYNQSDFSISIVTEVSYEIEWVPVNRSLYEHPKFREGGEFGLDTGMKIEVESWKKEKDTAARALFQYYNRDRNGNPVGGVITMEPNAAYFCEYLLLGIDSYDDYAPVLREVKTYAGSPPPSTSAGMKESPPGAFPGKPSGYEWRRNVDRYVRSASSRRWQRSAEWQGADKVLIDKTNLYL